MKPSLHRYDQSFLKFNRILFYFFLTLLLNSNFGFGKPTNCHLNKDDESTSLKYERLRFRRDLNISGMINFSKNSSNKQSNKEESLTCSSDMSRLPKNDIQMLELYRQLKFDDTYGGVWEQGFEITYDPKQWHFGNKLKVFVVPHSHNDPGWLKTFEEYYRQTTQHILDNMVEKLPVDKRRKFIWAEISFFKLWWDEKSEEIREKVRKLVADGQLEFVSGGWVMPDEAVSHWMAQLTQLTEGHQWLKKNLNYQPTSSWAIDPFGLSPTMPYLLKNSGLNNVLIQRVHYAVKKRFAQDQSLEFRWRQLWDTTGSSEILTHLMPFASYNIERSCGPNSSICRLFDFQKVYYGGITEDNVAGRAELVLDQYRKKSQLYKSNVVLVPLGDDFRFNEASEWDGQYNNYQKLFDYMNSHPHLNVNIQFGTLTDYFNAVRCEEEISEFPSLSGDFFTYADKHVDYWSGYYTSRPFHKRLDRMLLGSLRAAEIIAAIAWKHGYHQLVEDDFQKHITEAREFHSLFQHHDGITGTARKLVVVDYAEKMITALQSAFLITQQSVANLLKKNATVPFLYPESVYLSMDEVISCKKQASKHQLLELSRDKPAKKLVIYNPLPRQRTKVQTLVVSTPFVQVTNRNGEPLQCQISPYWTATGKFSSKRYKLSFVVSVPGFGIETYSISFVEGVNLPANIYMADVKLLNSAASSSAKFGDKEVDISSSGEFSITQKNITAYFWKSGLLKAIRVGDTITSVNVEFMKYNTFESGAYLFKPSDKLPKLLYWLNYQVVHVVEGPILSRVFVQLPQVTQTYTLFNSPGSDGLGLHISNKVDITRTHNFELVMRLQTNIASGSEFFTDLNGLNMIRRQRFSKLPVQANYYPLPTAGYIQDDQMRLTVVTGQPLGATSMASGQFEVMQDRRLDQDDWRGLAQDVHDNLLTDHKFMLLLEKRKQSCSSVAPDHPSGALSVGGLLASEEILHPPIIMFSDSSEVDCKDHFTPSFDLPVDLAIVSLRAFPVPINKTIKLDMALGMVLHRQFADVCWENESISSGFELSGNGEVNVGKLLNLTQEWNINKASLTFNSIGRPLQSSTISLCPHQLSAVLAFKSQFN